MKKRWYQNRPDQFVYLDREELTAAGMFKPVCEMVAGMLRAQVECERLAAEVEVRNDRRLWSVNYVLPSRMMEGGESPDAEIVVEIDMGLFRVRGLLNEDYSVDWFLSHAEVITVGRKHFMTTIGLARLIVNFNEWLGVSILRSAYEVMLIEVEKKKHSKGGFENVVDP